MSLARALAWPPPEVTLWGGGSGSSGSGSGSGSGEDRSSSPSLSPSSSLLLPPRVALVCSLRPERAITEVLQWTRDYGLAGKIAAEVAYEYLAIVRGDDDNNDKVDGTGNESDKNNNDADGSKKNRPPFSFSSPRPGVARWLSALRSARVPSTVVTSLDRETLLAALERMGLLSGSDGILLSPSSLVTAEDGAESLAQSLLAGALKLDRPPNACCAFVASPAGVAAAHNASMRAVAVSGAEHSAHELRSADATVSRLDELRVIQVRRLFSSGGAEGAPGAFMGKQKERAPGAGGGKESFFSFLFSFFSLGRNKLTTKQTTHFLSSFSPRPQKKKKNISRHRGRRQLVRPGRRRRRGEEAEQEAEGRRRGDGPPPSAAARGGARRWRWRWRRRQSRQGLVGRGRRRRLASSEVKRREREFVHQHCKTNTKRS